ncbi:MAG TPA: sigma-54 dependent transcriptional regulator [Thermodesulfovibrionales bacterium]|nr:sigma-54 dependent transcriptional regulator [Thermodesulfovibrionales bacterium]
MTRILVVDDEEPFRRLLKKELTRKGFVVEVAPDAETALSILREAVFHVILVDIVMPGTDGISLMKRLKQDPAAPVIIVLTGKATVETAVEAMKHGAFDYLSKPYKLEELTIIITRAYEYGRLALKTQLLQQELMRQESPLEFVAKSSRLKNILSLVRKIAPTDSTVLIQGESGTGKELIANAIWHYSKRNELPFIALNCATFSEPLLESELFGYEKGSHSTAYDTKYGIVEVADKGTLLLDEIGEIPLNLQAKLLRFLDSGEFRRVGGNKTFKTAVRVVAATNKNLADSIKGGLFREDLYYRLNVINIAIPPLRERREDIPELAGFFLRKYSQKMVKPIIDLTPEALSLLNDYRWPGNVRELENVIERAVILCDTEMIRPEDLSIPALPTPREMPRHPSLEDMEKEYILRVLREAGGNQSKTSQILGIDRKTLYLKLRKYGILNT